MRKEEKEEKGVKKFPFSQFKRSHFSKPKDFSLGSENILSFFFFFSFFVETRRNMVTFGCWKKEKRNFFFGNIFGKVRTKVRGLKLKVEGIFPKGINNCLLILSELACSCL